jgi:hypothetical protein
MNEIRKIVGMNLLILFLYVVITALYTSGQNALELMLLIAGHFVICLLIGIGYYIAKKNVKGNALVLSSFLVLLIGFSTCVAINFGH